MKNTAPLCVPQARGTRHVTAVVVLVLASGCANTMQYNQQTQMTSAERWAYAQEKFAETCRTDWPDADQNQCVAALYNAHVSRLYVGMQQEAAAFSNGLYHAGHSMQQAGQHNRAPAPARPIRCTSSTDRVLGNVYTTCY